MRDFVTGRAAGNAPGVRFFVKTLDCIEHLC